jgi:hypothetical protein
MNIIESCFNKVFFENIYGKLSLLVLNKNRPAGIRSVSSPRTMYRTLTLLDLSHLHSVLSLSLSLALSLSLPLDSSWGFSQLG